METRSIEAASLSARAGGDASDRPSRMTEGLVEAIFGQLVALEDAILAGKSISKSLADPISRLDSGGPTFPPEALTAEEKSEANVSAPCHIEKLERIRDRVNYLREEQIAVNKITATAYQRLDVAV